MSPLQVPGGPELLVIGLIVVILAGIVFAVVSLVKRLDTSTSDRQQRIQELEARVAELEAEDESDERSD